MTNVDLKPPSKEVAELPVSVIMERQPIVDNPWTTERWLAVGVVAAEAAATSEPKQTLIRSDESGDQYLWQGFSLELYRDDSVSYYSNLLGEKPSVFVICHEDEGSELTPFLVTVSYDEAASYMETDEPVFSVPMPPEVYRWVERYVLENHFPEKTKKRRRVKWTGGDRAR